MNTFRNLYLHSEYSLLSLESESSEGIFVVHEDISGKWLKRKTKPLMLDA